MGCEQGEVRLLSVRRVEGVVVCLYVCFFARAGFDRSGVVQWSTKADAIHLV